MENFPRREPSSPKAIYSQDEDEVVDGGGVVVVVVQEEAEAAAEEGLPDVAGRKSSSAPIDFSLSRRTLLASLLCADHSLTCLVCSFD